MFQRAPYLLLITVLTLLLSGCGFALRGDYQLPTSMTTLHLDSSSEYDPLTKLVAERLRRNHIKLVSAAEDVPTLRLGKEESNNRVLSLYSTGQVAEYELSYRVKVSVIRTGLPDEQITVQLHRDYQDNPLAALAKSRERELIMSELRTSAANEILRQLATIE